MNVSLNKPKTSFWLCVLSIFLFYVPLIAIWDPPVMVSTPGQDEINFNGGDDLDVNDSNNGVAVWVSPSAVYYQISASSYTFESGWSVPQVISPAPVGDEEGFSGHAKVALNNENNAVAIWDLSGVQNSGIPGIFAATRDSSGVWASAVRITDPAPSDSDFNAFYPNIALNDDGLAVAVWVEQHSFVHPPQFPPGSVAWFVYSSYSQFGGPWSTPIAISSALGTSVNAPFPPDIRMNENGDAIAIWKADIPLGAGGVLVNSSLFDGATQTWTTPFDLGQANNFDTNDQNQPQAAIDENGNAVALWTWSSNGLNTILYGASYVDGIWGAPVQIFQNPSSNTFRQRLVVDPLGNATAMWESSGSIYSSSLPFGGTWSAPVIISIASTNQNALNTTYFNHELDVDSHGNVIGIYTQNFYGSNPQQPMSVTRYFGSDAWEAPEIIASQNDVELTNIGFGSCGFALSTWISTNPDDLHHVWSSTSLTQFGPPCSLRAARCSQQFAMQKVTVTLLEWNPCDPECVLFYNLYRNGVLIATIPAGAQTSFVDFFCERNVTYTLTETSIFGIESPPLTIVLP